MDRRQVVKIAPALRGAIADAEEQAARLSVPAQKPGQEPRPAPDRSDDFSM